MNDAPFPRLLAITDSSQLDPPTLVTRLRELAGAARPASLAVLLRDHAASARQRLDLGRELRAVTRATGQELWVADRLDLALLLEADGLHLGEASVHATSARRLWARRLSRAWHTVDGTAQAELEGVDALLLSPLLAERKGRPALGLAALSQLERSLPARQSAPALYALGGVTAENAAACLAAGATGVAAIGAALAPDSAALLGALGIAR